MLLAGLIRFLNYTPIKKVIFKQKLVSYVRGYATLPTLWKKHAEPFSFLKVFTGYIPTRFETLVIVGYLIPVSYTHLVYLPGRRFNPTHKGLATVEQFTAY